MSTPPPFVIQKHFSKQQQAKSSNNWRIQKHPHSFWVYFWVTGKHSRAFWKHFVSQCEVPLDSKYCKERKFRFDLLWSALTKNYFEFNASGSTNELTYEHVGSNEGGLTATQLFDLPLSTTGKRYLRKDVAIYEAALATCTIVNNQPLSTFCTLICQKM